MTRIGPRFACVLLASAFALAAAGASPALSKAPPVCDTQAQTTSGLASDPEEGGQATTARAGTGWDLKRNPKTGVAATSDPEEGGQIAAAKKASGKAHFSEFQVMKLSDKASAKSMDSSPSAGGCQH